MAKAVGNDVVYVILGTCSVPSVFDVGITVTEFGHRLSVNVKGVKAGLRNDGGARVSVNGEDLGIGPEEAQATKEPCFNEVVNDVALWEGQKSSVLL